MVSIGPFSTAMAPASKELLRHLVLDESAHPLLVVLVLGRNANRREK